MATQVLTPITQALNAGTITRRELKEFMKRSDGPAFRHLAIWVVVLAWFEANCWRRAVSQIRAAAPLALRASLTAS